MNNNASNGISLRINRQPVRIPHAGRVWVVGPTGSGKSTLAKQLQAVTGGSILECGSFARAACAPDSSVEAITAHAMSVLEKDPQYFKVKIEAALAAKEGSCPVKIIVGARNPNDLIPLFRKHDVLILVRNGSLGATEFERYGLRVIEAYAQFMAFMHQEMIAPRTYAPKGLYRVQVSPGDVWFTVEADSAAGAP